MVTLMTEPPASNRRRQISVDAPTQVPPTVG
jgi:hypothetical protein